MNLMDYRVTSAETVYAEIAKRAAAAGVEIVESELVGLIPRDALIAAARERLKLRGLKPEQVIENHFDAARTDAYRCFDPFVDALASGAPTPGGGSASALAGALGAALGAMVTNLTIGKKKFAAVEADLVLVRERLLRGLESLRAEVRADAVLYDSVMAAYKLPKATPAEEAVRGARIEAALLLAAQGPLAVMEQAAALIPDLMIVAEKGNPNAASDAAVGALLVQACVHGAAMNVLINAKALGAHPQAEGLRTRTSALRKSVDRGAPAVVAAVERSFV
jgi:glutamate formiminotransferase/formiminotetrahydrofolate cyclodeaminase